MAKTSEWPRKNMTFHPDVFALLQSIGEIEDVAAWRVLDALVRLGVEVVLNHDNEAYVPPAFAKPYFEEAGLTPEQIISVREEVAKMVS